MAPINLVELIKGLMPIVIAALVWGHLGELRTWAARETLGPWQTRPFFRVEYQRVMASKRTRLERQRLISPAR